MDKRYGWVIVAAGALITCVAMGAMFALPVYLQPIADDTGWSRAGISAAMTVGFLAMGVAGFFWGTLSDRIGARPVVLIAALMLGAGLVLASRTTDLLVFQIAYGGLVGASGGAFLRADHRRHHRLVRPAPQPCRVAGVDRRRRRPDGDDAARQRLDRRLWLAQRHAGDRARRHPRHPPRRLPHPPRPSRRSRANCRSGGADTALGHCRGPAHAAVHRPRRSVLPLLRRPFRPHLPHRPATP